MDTRESSLSRRDGLSTSPVHPVIRGESNAIDAPESADVDARSDVASLVPPLEGADGSITAVHEVAGLNAAPAPDQAAALDQVKSLVSPDSPAAALTGIVEPASETTAPAPRRRFRPRIRRPHVGPVHVPVRVHTFDSFRYQNYVFLWIATVLSSGGFWLQQVIVGWLAYEVTGSAFWTSLALGLDALPILLGGPVGGLLVDNFDRRRLLAYIYGYQACVTLGFAGLVLGGLLEPWHIFGFIMLMGVSWVISDPARMSLIPNLVPKEGLVNAFALNSMAFSVTRLAAPVVGGVLIVLVGVGPTLLVEAVLQAAAVAAAFTLRLAPTRRPKLHFGDIRGELLTGVRYVAGEPLLVALFTLTAIPAILLMPSVQALMPVYAAEVFSVDARGLGLLLSAIGAGSTVGTFALASIRDLPRRGVAIICSMTVVALATLAFSVNGVFLTAYVNLMVLSAAMMTFFSVSSATMQSTVPDEYRGRVTGLYMMTWGLFPAGSLAVGFLAERLGAPHATQIACGGAILLFGIAAWRFKFLWKLK